LSRSLCSAAGTLRLRVLRNHSHITGDPKAAATPKLTAMITAG